MLKIIKYPNDILRETMPEFDFSNPIMNPTELEKQMIETMFQNNGIGLSANQVGIKARVFTMGHKDNPQLAKAFFNPIILEAHEEILDMEEGCLSFPNTFVKIKRPVGVYAKWQDTEGNWHQGEFNGYDCKCFLHEYDHLEGIVFKDRVTNLKWNMAVKKGLKANGDSTK